MALVAFERAQYILEKKGITHMQEVNELMDMMQRILMPNGNGAEQGKEVVSEGDSLRGAKQLLRIKRIKHKKGELEHALGTGPSEEIADHCRSDVQRARNRSVEHDRRREDGRLGLATVVPPSVCSGASGEHLNLDAATSSPLQVEDQRLQGMSDFVEDAPKKFAYVAFGGVVAFAGDRSLAIGRSCACFPT